MINLLPRDTVFFDLFESVSTLAVDAADRLERLAQQFPEALDEHILRIRDLEHQADDLAHQALERLDQTFITPFDREDIYDLVNGIDDVIDAIDALAKRIPIFHVTAMPPSFVEQAGVLVLSTRAMSNAVHRVRRTRKLSEMKDALIEIHRLESLGDDVNHAAIRKLFDGSTQPLDAMKWKDLYDYAEQAIDGCEDVGNILERIVLKNG